MRAFIYNILCVFVLMNESSCQDFPNPLELQILEEQIDAHEDSILINFTARFTNKTEGNILLYNTKSIEVGHPIFQDCSDSSSFGAQMTFTTLFKNGEVVPYVINHVNTGVGVTSDSLQNALNNLKQHWVLGKAVLKPNQHVDISYILRPELELAGYEQLKKGRYQIYLFYRAGTFVKKFLGPDQVSKDCTEANASLFLGCIKSNSITLVIE